MTDHDAIRRALDDLVAAPPVPLSRKGAVMSRIHTMHRRRAAVQATLALTFVIAASAGALRVIRAEPVGLDTLVDPKPSASATAEPKESVQPKPTTKPSTASKKPAAVTPTKSAEPSKPQQTEAKSTKPATTLDALLYVATELPVAGQRTDLKVKVWDGSGRLLRVELSYGDGTRSVLEPGDACTSSGVEWRQYFGHVYAKAGRYVARVAVTTGGCGTATESTVREAVVAVGGVAPKPSPSPTKTSPTATNGPALPTVTAEPSTPQPSVAAVSVTGSDADGFVKKFLIEWGDGSQTYLGPRSLELCSTEPGTMHPAASTWQQTSDHAYTTPGTYTVTVTVLSTSCDGSDGQSAATTVSVTV